MRAPKPFWSVACGLVLIAMAYAFVFPPLAAWIERRGIYSDWLARLEPDYQTVATHLPWLSDYYNFCEVYRRTSEPPDIGHND
jgi:hypothetical protein